MYLMLLTFVIGLVTVAAEDEVTTSCFECASPELKYNWHLTMFENKINNDRFGDACSTKADAKWITSCPNSVCVAYFFQVPRGLVNPLKPDDDTNKLTGYVVRGCLSTLTSASASELAAKYPKMACFAGTNPFYSLTTTQHDPLKAMVKFCPVKDADKCNIDVKDERSSTDPPYVCKEGTDSGKKTPGTCITCAEESSNCKKTDTGKSSSMDANPKNWCFKAYSRFGLKKKQKTVRKHASAVNPYGLDVCKKVDITEASLFPHLGPMENEFCFCSDKDCNGASGLAGGVLGMLTAVALAMLR